VASTKRIEATPPNLKHNLWHFLVWSSGEIEILVARSWLVESDQRVNLSACVDVIGPPESTLARDADGEMNIGWRHARDEHWLLDSRCCGCSCPSCRARPNDGEGTQEPGGRAISRACGRRVGGTRSSALVEAVGNTAAAGWCEGICREWRQPRRGCVWQELSGGDWEGGESRWFGSIRSAPTQTSQGRCSSHQHVNKETFFRARLALQFFTAQHFPSRARDSDAPINQGCREP
jgi:hypothetical protein